MIEIRVIKANECMTADEYTAKSSEVLCTNVSNKKNACFLLDIKHFSTHIPHVPHVFNLTLLLQSLCGEVWVEGDADIVIGQCNEGKSCPSPGPMYHHLFRFKWMTALRSGSFLENVSFSDGRHRSF